jgi:hypothetical protein
VLASRMVAAAQRWCLAWALWVVQGGVCTTQAAHNTTVRVRQPAAAAGRQRNAQVLRTQCTPRQAARGPTSAHQIHAAPSLLVVLVAGSQQGSVLGSQAGGGCSTHGTHEEAWWGAQGTVWAHASVAVVATRRNVQTAAAELCKAAAHSDEARSRQARRQRRTSERATQAHSRVGSSAARTR